MIPTGGSSGQIRFAIHTWETLMASVRGFQQYFQLNQVNSLCVLPLYHVSGLMQFCAPLPLVAVCYSAIQTLSDGQSNIDPIFFIFSANPAATSPTESSANQLAIPIWNSATRWRSSLSTLLEQARRHGIRLHVWHDRNCSQIATLKPEDFLAVLTTVVRFYPAKVTIRTSTGHLLGANQTGIITIAADSLALGYYPAYGPEYFPSRWLGFFWFSRLFKCYRSAVTKTTRATQLVNDVCVLAFSPTVGTGRNSYLCSQQFSSWYCRTASHTWGQTEQIRVLNIGFLPSRATLKVKSTANSYCK